MSLPNFGSRNLNRLANRSPTHEKSQTLPYEMCHAVSDPSFLKKEVGRGRCPSLSTLMI